MSARNPRRMLGALWMLLPAGAAALGAALLLQGPGGTSAVTPPHVADPEAPVAAFGGRLAGASGADLIARLAPMHADPERQAFEAAALGGRLGLGAGEPWRLSLRFERSAGGDRRASAPEPILRLGAIVVDDERGTALRAIAAGPAAVDGGGAADPLRSLFAPPGGALEPGHEVDWILWGRAPGPGARLAGLEPGGLGHFELQPRTVRRSEVELPVARLDRAGPATGKTAAGGASE